jgi:DNA polymerase III subunit beta
MNFVIPRNDLIDKLQSVAGVVEKRSAVPILSNLLIEAHDGALEIGASDMEVTIRSRAAARVSARGSVTLPAAKLVEIARSLPESDVEFKLLDRHQVSIHCERTRYKISGQPKDEFPVFPDVHEEDGIKLPGKLLKLMIDRVVFAVTTEDARYTLNGALMILKDKVLTLVATDGHRLAFVSKTLDVTGPKEELRLVVPRKALVEVSKLASSLDSDEMIVFGKVSNHIFFVVGDHRLTSNLLDDRFPRYENVLPKACETVLTLPTEELMSAVRRVSLLASDRLGKAIRFGLSPGKLELFSRTDLGEAQDTLVLDYEGDELGIGFNARYLLDFLSTVGSPSVRLELNPERGDETTSGPGDRPGQFRPEPQDEMTYRYVVMPMHL